MRKNVQSRVGGAQCRIVQVTSDAAAESTSCAIRLLGIHKSPDLFHIQQDITKGLTCDLARRTKNAEDALKANQETQKTEFERMKKKLNAPQASLQTKPVAKSFHKCLEANKREAVLQSNLEGAKNDQETVKQATRSNIISA